MIISTGKLQGMAWKLVLKSAEQIEKDVGIDITGEKTRQFRDLADKYMDAYIPMQSGTLKNSKRYPANNIIEYLSPYAHYMYMGELYLAPNGSSWAKKGEKKVATGKKLNYAQSPKRGANWDKRMYADRKKDLVRALNK